MKVSIKGLAMLAMAGVMSLAACKKDDDDKGGGGSASISSIMADNVDLYGATAATDVASDAQIVVTFGTDVDAASAEGIKLMRGTTEVATTITTSGKMVTIVPDGGMATGTAYTLDVSGVKSTGGSAISTVSVTFTTAGVGLDTAPQRGAQTLYLQFDGDVEDLAGTATAAFEQNSWTTDRFGKENAAAYFDGAPNGPGTGDAVEMTGGQFMSPSQTVSVWFKINSTDYAQGNPSRMMFGSAVLHGYFVEVFTATADKKIRGLKYTTVHKVDPDPNNHVGGQAWTEVTGGGNPDGERTVVDWAGDPSDFLADKWCHMVMTFDAASYTKTIYLDGVMVKQMNYNAGTTEWYLKDLTYMPNQADIDQNLMIGFAAARGNMSNTDSWGYYNATEQTFKGAIDDFRIYNVALNSDEVNSLYNSEKP